ncbi:Peptidase S1, PA clan,Serine proteases, trypsin domain [Cinara cedri]|uniref:Peptidase S1, PA clan,Serine proteases, trypsin domain n=1 Tax=Cinara cedri TaxID=506608 RepID=A0A5E4NG46_9HEMI|nr:Peptidase S1, PA clan,Serine proteases, trypsin domain [Cinara cedri]
MKTFTGLCVVLACFELAINICYGYYDNGYVDIQRQPPQYVPQGYFSNLPVEDVSKFPYHVVIVDSSNTMTNPYNKPRIVCQGALINNNWIITSASCVWMNYGNLHPETTYAVIGTNRFLENYHEGANIYKLSYPVFHPQFDTQTGKGNDVALWKLNTPIMNPDYSRVINLVDQPRLPILSNCEYTTNIDHTLYGTNARLMNVKPCETFGVPDDIGNCVMMKNTPHDNTKYFETGCPLVCDNKLYALRNVDGHFTTAYNSKSWMDQVINERQNYDRNIPSTELTTLRSPMPRNPRIMPEFNEEKPYTSSINNKPDELSLADTDQYNKFGDFGELYNSFSHPLNIQKTRLRRAIGPGDIDLIFQSWAKSVSRMDPERQLSIKIAISKIVTDGEQEELEKKQLLEFDKKFEEMEKKEEAEMRAESARESNLMKEERKREYLKKNSM